LGLLGHDAASQDESTIAEEWPSKCFFTGAENRWIAPSTGAVVNAQTLQAPARAQDCNAATVQNSSSLVIYCVDCTGIDMQEFICLYGGGAALRATGDTTGCAVSIVCRMPFTPAWSCTKAMLSP